LHPMFFSRNLPTTLIYTLSLHDALPISLVLTTTGGTLDGVTVNGDLDLTQVAGVNVTFKNTVTLNGTLSIGNAAGSTYGYAYFDTGSAHARTLATSPTRVSCWTTNNTLY